MNLGNYIGEAKAQREPEVQVAVCRLEDRVDGLHQTLDTLAARLALVSRDDRVVQPSTGVAKAVDPPRAPLAALIDAQAHRVNYAMERLGEILDVLEI